MKEATAVRRRGALRKPPATGSRLEATIAIGGDTGCERQSRRRVRFVEDVHATVDSNLSPLARAIGRRGLGDQEHGVGAGATPW
jgi:hypothetical protein